MRLQEFVSPAVSTGIATTGLAAGTPWAKYGPGVLQAVQQLTQGKPTTALVTALRTAAPSLPINARVQQGLSVASDLELLSTIVRNPAALATFLATFSRGAGEGEDEAVKRIHAQQDAQRGSSSQKS
jgi:hypothetical protein